MPSRRKAVLIAILTVAALGGGVGPAAAATSLASAADTPAAPSVAATEGSAAAGEPWCLVPNVRYMHIYDAANAFSDADLDWEFAESPGDNEYVARQSHLGGFLVPCWTTKVLLWMDDGCEVPLVTDAPLQTAYDRLAGANLRSRTTGQGKMVRSQLPREGTRVQCRSEVTLTLRRARTD